MFDNSAGGSCDLLHPVQGGPGLEPVDLLLVEGVVKEDGVGGSVAMAQHTLDLTAGSQGFETNEGDLVVWPHEVVVGLVVEGQWQHSLLLEVGLVNSTYYEDCTYVSVTITLEIYLPCKRLDNDGSASKEPGLKCGVLPGGALAVVLVTEHDPVNAGLLVLLRHLGHSAEFASLLILDSVHLAVIRVNGRDQKVLGDVLQVT